MLHPATLELILDPVGVYGDIEAWIAAYLDTGQHAVDYQRILAVHAARLDAYTTQHLRILTVWDDLYQEGAYV